VWLRGQPKAGILKKAWSSQLGVPYVTHGPHKMTMMPHVGYQCGHSCIVYSFVRFTPPPSFSFVTVCNEQHELEINAISWLLEPAAYLFLTFPENCQINHLWLPSLCHWNIGGYGMEPSYPSLRHAMPLRAIGCAQPHCRRFNSHPSIWIKIHENKAFGNNYWPYLENLVQSELSVYRSRQRRSETMLASKLAVIKD
jgi:hypothetical protein